MKGLLAFAALSALLAVSSATVQCDNYLNSTSYQEAIGRWVASYTWPGSHSIDGDMGLRFEAPTPEQIQSNRRTNPNAVVDTLTDNPKLVATSIYAGVDVLLDIGADKITRVKGYYNAYNYMRTDQYRLRKIGDFLVMDFCQNGKDECVSESAWMMHKTRLSNYPSDAEREAAACVVVPGTTGAKVHYRD